jgi:hypothetical protein
MLDASQRRRSVQRTEKSADTVSNASILPFDERNRWGKPSFADAPGG